ncbi:chemotaxis protein CheW [Sulfuritalea sp.]|uniref:chemotaxis protein CheW n=1 Tax=Sulfuritalea sp. TaxID=2480090 RepID=UPI00286E992D|nr:chemotaxis protein CheW [Sulfuritalea sp.]
MSSLVAFNLEGLFLALPLDRVARAVRAVAATPLPQAPEIVCGVINVQGRIVPVINLRRRFGLAERETGLDDQLLIAHSATRMLAMIVDAVVGVIECDEKDFVAVDSVVAGTRHLTGIVKSPDGMVLIHDLDSFLSLEEERALDAALSPAASAD